MAEEAHMPNASSLEHSFSSLTEISTISMVLALVAGILLEKQVIVVCPNLNERKVFEHEVARAKVTANRVITVVANDWKDANDKVMPVNQWLEESFFRTIGSFEEIKVERDNLKAKVEPYFHEIDEPALIPHIAEASSLTYPCKLLFRSLQKLLMDTATSEYHFCDDFFGEESIFYEIFSDDGIWQAEE